ncbi:cytochrome P450 307a1-like [Drosophila montana]|uniref:cytochrome P450 307a1-like n=1 Tax=Drosophila montana TaxID=40370 RepID=UPI00313B1F6B
MKESCISIYVDEPDIDFTDAHLKSLIENKNVSRNTIIFMLEDFIGGHSAVGNLVMLALAYVAKDPVIRKKIQCEIDCVSESSQRTITLHDMDKMPYTMATILEVLRYSSSPIIPHVATEDTSILGYGVTSGSIVFINNYVLNMSHKYWKDPDRFQRFLEVTSSVSMPPKCHDKRRCSEESDSGIEFEKDARIHNSSVQHRYI